MELSWIDFCLHIITRCMYYGMNILWVHVGPCQRVVGIIFEIKGYRWREGMLTEAIYLHSTPYVFNPRTPLPLRDLFSNISCYQCYHRSSIPPNSTRLRSNHFSISFYDAYVQFHFPWQIVRHLFSSFNPTAGFRIPRLLISP